MEEDSQLEKPAVSAFFRHRSPTFSKEEVKALLKIVEKHKAIVFNRSTSASASYAKETAWIKIAKIFNRQGFTHSRSADCLKIKWDNLKKEARKLSKNLMDDKYNDVDDVTNQMIVMMCDAASNTNVVEEPIESDEDLNETEQEKEITNEKVWNGDEGKDFDDSLDGGENERLVNRSLNFSPKECNLLLQCVKREKNIILSKDNSANANKVKSRAWIRITNSYNKLSPQKRSTKVLRTKFTNMKRLAKNVSLKDYFKDFNKKHEKFEEGSKQRESIKSEPIFDQYRSSLDADDVDNLNETDLELNNHVSSSLDPLRSVLNSDFGTGAINNVESKEIVKLKTELLHFKMETAKLQRKRIEDLIQADAVNREAKATETSLRLRAARLEAVAAEMKLPPTHPALSYTAEEARAQHYIHQYHAS
ncbi:unnamed protein product [Arctia plantaginis]|uniref:Regulatory protein zeste n=1 Tax=Arctia plantaginis TaxID=874455 RepID=A0A8S0YN77_ARCPL|nr:unnamed protein product [Arctia plantaginis]